MKTLQSIIHKPTRQLNLSPSKPLQMNYNQINFTYDYDQFKFIKGNRHVDQNHVRNLINSMKDKYLQIAIDVNEKMEIIDGQHRFMAIKELKLPLYYVVKKGWGIKEMQMANTTAQKWTGRNTLESQCALGNIHYIRFNEIMQRYNTSVIATRICLNHSITVDQYKRGFFTMTDLQYQKGERLIQFLVGIKKQYKIDTTRLPMLTCFVLLMDNPEFDFDVFLSKLTYLHNRLFPTVKKEEQLMQIETIYNYRNRKPLNLRIKTKNQ